MARRELDALRRHEIEERIVRRRDRLMDGADDAFVGLRAADRQHVGIGAANRLRFGAHAARDDDFAVFFKRGADRRERFGLGAVEKAAGIDDDGIGAGVGAGQLIAFGAQPRDDSLAVDESFGTAERNEGDFGRAGGLWAADGSRVMAVHCHVSAAAASRAGRNRRAGRRHNEKTRPQGPGSWIS